MVKQRLSSADIAAEAAYLRSRCVGMRCSNVYDLSARSFVFKLARSGENGDKVLLLLDSGSRLHTIDSMPARESAPRPFAAKLRMHVRGRRLEAVSQLGADRCVDLQFGSGPNANHVLLECFAQGNIILTDERYTVLSLLRSHRDDDGGIVTMPGHPYPIASLRTREHVDADRIRAALELAARKAAASGADGVADGAGVGAPPREAAAGGEAPPEGTGLPEKRGRKKRRAAAAPPTSLRVALQGAVAHGPSVADHCALGAGLDPLRDVGQDPLSEGELRALAERVAEWERWMDGLADAGTGLSGAPPPPKGWLVYDRDVDDGRGEAEPAAAGGPEGAGAGTRAGAGAGPGGAGGDGAPLPATAPVGAEPLPLLQHASRRMVALPSFDDALRVLFARSAAGKARTSATAREDAAAAKLRAIREAHEARLAALADEAEAARLDAEAVQARGELADAALGAVRDALATGMAWDALADMIGAEAEAGNPVAALVDRLDLATRRVSVRVGRVAAGGAAAAGPAAPLPLGGKAARKAARGAGVAVGSGAAPGAGGAASPSPVWLDLDLSAHANAEKLFDLRRKLLAKRARTLEADVRGVRAAETKAEARLARAKATAEAAEAAGRAEGAVRKPAWYERFLWFPSSEGLLVVSARDPLQADVLLSRRSTADDVLVHADLDDAPVTLVLGSPSAPVTALSLSEAGAAVTCRSSAWQQKRLTSAWWAPMTLVALDDGRGGPVPSGHYRLLGPKNYLPPQPVVLGLGYLFGLADDAGVRRHAGERAARSDPVLSGARAAGRPKAPAAGRPAAASRDAAAGADADADDARASLLDSALTAGVDPLASSFSRYGLAAPRAAPAPGPGPDGAARGAEAADDWSTGRAKGAKKKGAKGGGTKSGAAKGGGDADVGAPGDVERSAPSAVPSVASSASRLSARTERAKAKKARAFAEQDEEDRALALAALGSAGVRKSREDRRAEHKAKLAAKRAERVRASGAKEVAPEDLLRLAQGRFADGERAAGYPAPGEGDEAGETCEAGRGDEGGEGDESEQAAGQTAPGDTDEGERALAPVDEAAPPPGRGASLADAAAAGLAALSVREAPEARAEVEKAGRGTPDEEQAGASPTADAPDAAASPSPASPVGSDSEDEAGAPDAAESRAELQASLGRLTGHAREGDELAFAVPVVAPYSALSGVKLRVKLVPGTQKKGKAIRAALDVLLRGGGPPGALGKREAELILAVPGGDALAQMVAGTRVQAPGANKAAQAKPKGKPRGQKKGKD